MPISKRNQVHALLSSFPDEAREYHEITRKLGIFIILFCALVLQVHASYAPTNLSVEITFDDANRTASGIQPNGMWLDSSPAPWGSANNLTNFSIQRLATSPLGQAGIFGVGGSKGNFSFSEGTNPTKRLVTAGGGLPTRDFTLRGIMQQPAPAADDDVLSWTVSSTDGIEFKMCNTGTCGGGGGAMVHIRSGNSDKANLYYTSTSLGTANGVWDDYFITFNATTNTVVLIKNNVTMTTQAGSSTQATGFSDIVGASSNGAKTWVGNMTELCVWDGRILNSSDISYLHNNSGFIPCNYIEPVSTAAITGVFNSISPSTGTQYNDTLVMTANFNTSVNGAILNAFVDEVITNQTTGLGNTSNPQSITYNLLTNGGTHSIYFQLTNSTGGNVVNSTKQFINIPPGNIITINPSNQSQFGTNQVELNLTANISSRNTNVTSILNDGTKTTVLTSNNPFQTTIRLNQTIANGNYTVYYQLQYGNQTINSSLIFIYVDSTQPTITTNFVNNSMWQNTANITATINISDAGLLYGYNVSVDNSIVYSTSGLLANVSFQLNKNVANIGKHILRIQGFNGQFGNLNTKEANYSFYVFNISTSYQTTASELQTIQDFLYINTNSSDYNASFVNITINNLLNPNGINNITGTIVGYLSNYTIPIITGQNATYNSTWTATIGNQSYTAFFNQTIFKLQGTNCSDPSQVLILNFTTSDETTSASVLTNTNGIFTIYPISRTNSVQYNVSWNNASNQPFCLPNVASNYYVDYKLESTNAAYYPAHANAFNLTINQTVQNKANFLIAQSPAPSNDVVTVVDNLNNPVVGFILELNRYNYLTGQELPLRSELLNPVGSSSFYYTPTTQYAFRVYDMSGNLVLDTVTGLITQNPTPLRLLQTTPDYTTKTLSVWNIRSILYNTSTNIYLNWTTLNGQGTICMNVSNVLANNTVLLSSQCSSNPSGFLSYNVTANTGRIAAVGYIVGSAYITNLLSFVLNPGGSLYQSMGIDSLLLYVVLIFIAVAISLTRVTMMPFFLGIAHLVAWLMGLIPGTYATGVIAVMAALILIQIRVGK